MLEHFAVKGLIQLAKKSPPSETHGHSRLPVSEIGLGFLAILIHWHNFKKELFHSRIHVSFKCDTIFLYNLELPASQFNVSSSTIFLTSVLNSIFGMETFLSILCNTIQQSATTNIMVNGKIKIVLLSLQSAILTACISLLPSPVIHVPSAQTISVFNPKCPDVCTVCISTIPQYRMFTLFSPMIT